MKSLIASWQLWALLSASFAALTAIFAKVGVEGVGSDFATFVRTIVILLALGAILLGTGGWQAPASVSGRSYLFLALPGHFTGQWRLERAAATRAAGRAAPEPLDEQAPDRRQGRLGRRS